MGSARDRLTALSKAVDAVSSARSWLLADDVHVGIKARCLILTECETGSLSSDGEYLYLNPGWVNAQRPPLLKERVRSIVQDVVLSQNATVQRGSTMGLLAGNQQIVDQIHRRMIRRDIELGLRRPEHPHDIIDEDIYYCPQPGYETALYDLPGGGLLRFTRRLPE